MVESSNIGLLYSKRPVLGACRVRAVAVDGGVLAISDFISQRLAHLDISLGEDSWSTIPVFDDRSYKHKQRP